MPRELDVDALKASVDLVTVVERYVELRRHGREWSGLCPFHAENTPSFHVIPNKGFVHCFGCGAHHDVIGFLQRITGCTFKEACVQLGAHEFANARKGIRAEDSGLTDATWLPLIPVPDDAPELLTDGGWTVPIWNPKRSRMTRMKTSRADAYRSADGRLLGYVLRAEFPDRETGRPRKWTPTVTWCVSPEGKRQWCLQHFPEPRPLLGLDDLHSKPDAPVLLVEGEKCRAAGARAWPQYAVVCWPGGSNGLAKVDWTPLHGRDLVLWPDADVPGHMAMIGWRNDAGDYRPGVAAYATRAGARSIRLIDTEGRPKGWDIADAFEKDGWTAPQLAAWAAARVVPVTVVRG